MDAVDVILVEVVDDDPAFLVVAEDLDLRCENALHIAHHLFEFDGDLSCLPRSLGDGFPCKVEAHSVLYLADGEFVVARLFCKVDEIVLVVDGDERSCVPGGELTFSHHLGDLFRELQQPQSVGDVGAGFAYPERHFLLSQPVIFHELAHSFRGFYRVQVFAVQVLDEGYLADLLIGEFADDGGHFFETRDGRGAEPSFTRHDEISAVLLFDEQQGLQHAVCGDGRRHLFEAFVRKRFSRLIGVAVDLGDGDLHRRHVFDFHFYVFFVVGEESGEPFSAESAFRCHKHLTCLFFGEILPRVFRMLARPRTSGRTEPPVFRSSAPPRA